MPFHRPAGSMPCGAAVMPSKGWASFGIFTLPSARKQTSQPGTWSKSFTAGATKDIGVKLNMPRSSTSRQEKKRANRRMIDFLLQDAGERTHKRYWTVYHPGTEQRRGLHTGYLFVPGSARPQLLSGYAAYDQVFVIIHEQINPKTKRRKKSCPCTLMKIKRPESRWAPTASPSKL